MSRFCCPAPTAVEQPKLKYILPRRALVMPAIAPTSGSTIGGWLLGEHLGSGEFGSVFSAERASGPMPAGGPWAVKVATLAGTKAGKTGRSAAAVLLAKEYTMYTSKLRPSMGDPAAKCWPFARLSPVAPFGEDATVAARWLAMERLGAPLGTLAARGPIPWPTVAAVGLQLLSAIETLHLRAGVLFADWNLGNVCLASGTSSRLVLVDFGAATSWRDTRTGFALAADVTRGAPTFAPLAAALCAGASPLDDAESLGYVLAALAAGGAAALPWSSARFPAARGPEDTAAEKLRVMRAHMSHGSGGGSNGAKAKAGSSELLASVASSAGKQLHAAALPSLDAYFCAIFAARRPAVGEPMPLPSMPSPPGAPGSIPYVALRAALARAAAPACSPLTWQLAESPSSSSAAGILPRERPAVIPSLAAAKIVRAAKRALSPAPATSAAGTTRPTATTSHSSPAKKLRRR